MRRIFILVGLVIPVLASAQIVDQQPSADGHAYPSDGIFTAGKQIWSASTADNFTLNDSVNVSQITFWGGSNGATFPDLTNFNAFDVAIYSSDFSKVLYSTEVSTSSLNPVATGRELVDGATGGNAGAEYFFDLGANFELNAGQYWISIGSVNADPKGDTFLWTSAVADGQLATNYFNGKGWKVATGTAGSDSDQAFQIFGQVVPEPPAVLSLGIGAFLLLARRQGWLDKLIEM
jgi:hypothetical protein